MDLGAVATAAFTGALGWLGYLYKRIDSRLERLDTRWAEQNGRLGRVETRLDDHFREDGRHQEIMERDLTRIENDVRLLRDRGKAPPL